MVSDSQDRSLTVIPEPGTDLVPDGWWRDVVVPWADAQTDSGEIRQAAAQVDALVAAYKTLDADTLELMRARRMLEVRWGELLEPQQGKRTDLELRPRVVEVSPQEATRFRKLAAIRDKVEQTLEDATDADQVTRAALLRTTKTSKVRRLPLVTDGPVPTLIEGRAEDLELDDESIDLIITSPPYNLGESAWPMGGLDEDGIGRQARSGIGYTDDLDELAYQSWQVNVFVELFRVAKPGASFFYNHKVRQRHGQFIHPMDWLRDDRSPWTLRQEIIWDRGSTHNHTATLFWPHDERIYWMTKGKPRLPEEPLGTSTVWSFHGPRASESEHPAPFAEELVERILQAVAVSGSVVLDPYGGSMTTCRVAQKYGLESVGIDVNPDYLVLARRENGW